MTMASIHTYANPPTPRAPAARFSASARPIPPALRSGRTSPAWFDPLWAMAVLRARITATVVALLAVVLLFVAASPAVVIPIMTFLIAGLFVGGAFLLVERLTRPTPAAAPGRPDRDTRRDA
jgi:hypothetical protein